MDLKKSLEKLSSIDWNKKFPVVDSKTFDEINSLYYNLFPFLAVHAEFYFKEQFSESLFRVRPFKEIENRHNFSEYFYPPANHVKNQRANISANPVLYTSLHPETAVLEYVLNQNAKTDEIELSLSTWELRCDRNIKVANFISEETTFGDTKFLGISSDLQFRNYINKTFKSEDLNVLEELRKFYIKSFCTTDSHVFSSFLAHKFMHFGETDLIIYPSIIQNNTSLNIAFSKNFADKYLKLKTVYKIHTSKDNLKTPKFDNTVLFFKENKFGYEKVFNSREEFLLQIEEDFKDSLK
jgi:hypothetical protein